MFKRSSFTKQKAQDVTLEVRQYGKILPSKSALNTSVTAGRRTNVSQENRRTRAQAQGGNEASGGLNRSMCQKTDCKLRPSTAKRVPNRCPSRASKEAFLENKSTADTKSIKGSSEAEPQDSIRDLIEKAKKELEENQLRSVSSKA